MDLARRKLKRGRKTGNSMIFELEQSWGTENFREKRIGSKEGERVEQRLKNRENGSRCILFARITRPTLSQKPIFSIYIAIDSQLLCAIYLILKKKKKRKIFELDRRKKRRVETKRGGYGVNWIGYFIPDGNVGPACRLCLVACLNETRSTRYVRSIFLAPKTKQNFFVSNYYYCYYYCYYYYTNAGKGKT